jgi:hypothetical protein
MAIMQGFAPLVVGAIVVGVFASLLLSGVCWIAYSFFNPK